jgi:hypothetical protein
VSIAELSPFERPHLPFKSVDETALLIQLTSLLIQFTAHIFCGTDVSFQISAGTIKLFNGGHTTPELGKFLLLLRQFPLLLLDDTHVSFPVSGAILGLCLTNGKYRLPGTIEDFQVSSKWRSEHSEAQLAVSIPHLHSPTCFTGFGTQHHLASVIHNVHPLGSDHLGRCCWALRCKAHTQKQYDPHSQTQSTIQDDVMFHSCSPVGKALCLPTYHHQGGG